MDSVINISQQTADEPEAIKDQAAAWLVRLDGERGPELRADLQAWMARSPEHRAAITRLAKLWDQMNVLTELAVPLDKPAAAADTGPLHWLAGARWPALAASLVLALVVWQSVPVDLGRSNGLYATAIGEQRSLDLADGSRLQLNTGSEVQVRYGEQHRDIYLLAGEVHFDVAKNPDKPFRVFAGKGRVQAVGTAFTVYLKDRDIDVTVTEGRVALAGLQAAPTALERSQDASSTHLQPGALDANPDGIPSETLGQLSAGQGATIKPRLDGAEGLDALNPPPLATLENVHIYKAQDLQRRLAWREGMLVFEGESLAQVVAEVSRYDTVEIQIPEAEVRAIKVGGQFAVGDTQDMLNTLEVTFSLRVERNAAGDVSIYRKRG